MGFCRTPISANLSTEERSGSFKIHAHYSWSPKESPDGVDLETGTTTEFRGQHIEIDYSDLPALIRDLQEIETKNYDLCHPADSNTSSSS